AVEIQSEGRIRAGRSSNANGEERYGGRGILPHYAVIRCPRLRACDTAFCDRCRGERLLRFCFPPPTTGSRADILVLQLLESHTARNRGFEIYRGQVLTGDLGRQIRAVDPIVAAEDQRSLNRV